MGPGPRTPSQRLGESERPRRRSPGGPGIYSRGPGARPTGRGANGPSPEKVAAKKTPGDWSIGTITPGVTPTPGQRPGGQRDRRHPNENGPDKGGPLTRGDASAGREPRADMKKEGKSLQYVQDRNDVGLGDTRQKGLWSAI